jgi:predicted nucleotidyltransferase
MDILDLWKSLHDNEVRYLTIGGFAVNFYGYNRTTGDIDILIEDTLGNRQKLRKTLTEIGIGDFPQIESTQLIPGWTDFTLGPGLRLDVMTSVKGLDKNSFDELYQTSEITHIRTIPVRFIDFKHLIITKKATNRPKDQLDIDELEKIRKWREEK